MNSAVEIATRFAGLLDAEDYRAAQALIGQNCRYFCRGSEYSGPSAIIDAYKATGNSAKREFDQVKYESSVTAADDESALIHFTDFLCRGGRPFTFHCQQLIRIDHDGAIIHIQHIDLAGQMEALAEYLKDP